MAQLNTKSAWISDDRDGIYRMHVMTFPAADGKVFYCLKGRKKYETEYWIYRRRDDRHSPRNAALAAGLPGCRRQQQEPWLR